MTITLNGRDWSVDDFRDYRRNQPKAPDAAEVPAFPDGVFGDLLVELGQGQAAATGASASAAAAQASAAATMSANRPSTSCWSRWTASNRTRASS
ncbi:MAG: hypothetical protein HQL39_20385 [Alphaproteobacteria bacterium]|nr:hypothetical protein [Alphaproteobacteria bacterium]